MDARRDASEGRTGRIGAAIDDWFNGNRPLAYTILAIVGIVVLGLIVVPVSIPEPLPGPPASQVLGERYLRALPANAKDRPTLGEVQQSFGDDGGEACTGTLESAYGQLLTKRPGGGTAFSRAALADMRIVHRVYCPERTKEFNAYIRTRTAANARARAAAQQAAGVAA